MKQFSSIRCALAIALITFFSASAYAQSISATPQNIIRPVSPRTGTIQLSRSGGDWGGTTGGSYVWTVTPTTGVSFGSYSQTGSNAADVTATFTAAASGVYTFTLSRGSHTASIMVNVGNIAASLVNGDRVAALSVQNGNFIAGPNPVFNPLVSTAALGISADGYFYYLPNNFEGNSGLVNVYAARPDGSGSRIIGTADLNGASPVDLGFVRLAISPNGIGYILAGDNSTNLYLASFTANGINDSPITIDDSNVTIVNGTATSFLNGDICFSGDGTMFALADNTIANTTQIFVGQPNGANTTLTKKWDLVNESGTNFVGSVNGVAFDLLGSLYLSASTGLYFINQNTVNTANGTVQCALVQTMNGLTDLGSNFYPQQTTLPVRLVSFTGNYRDNTATLNWEVTSEENFAYYDIERSINGRDFISVGAKQAAGSENSRVQYQFPDNLAGFANGAYIYRLRIVDIDGRYTYSNAIVLRKDSRSMTGLVLNPSPVTNGQGSIRFNAVRRGEASLRVLDLSGRVLLQQVERVFEGTNSFSINNLDRLPAGAYVLQLNSDEQTETVKFTVVK